jgi:murein DD-endopeptidase MepM/ murein hydrolase activator NlpD
MADEARTFRLTDPHMQGEDVKAWQVALNRQMRTWGINHRVPEDGDYGALSRDLTATCVFGLGIPLDVMAEGVTPELRSKMRHKELSAKQRALFVARAPWRARLKRRHDVGAAVAPPLAKILSSSWGYHPPVHDGVDLICPPNVTGYAICTGEIIRADAGGWWGKGAPSPAIAAKGDGIVVLRCTVNAGPFRPGLNFCYGHAEHPQVRVGDRVKAGDPICRAGLANAWHFHFMVNARNDAKGVGDRDPMPYVNYARKNG